MKEANERVRTLTLQRTNEKMGVTVGALKAARTTSDTAYRALVKMVNALALVLGEEDYTAFIDYVNTEVTHYKREVIGQKAKAPPHQATRRLLFLIAEISHLTGAKPSGGGSSSSGDNTEIEL